MLKDTGIGEITYQWYVYTHLDLLKSMCGYHSNCLCHNDCCNYCDRICYCPAVVGDRFYSVDTV